jgi:hypothetical protein
VKKAYSSLLGVGLILFLCLFLPTRLFSAVLPGDINGDGRVDIVDIGALIDVYSLPASADPRADLNGDGMINIIDVGIIIDNYGRILEGPTPTPVSVGGLSANPTFHAIGLYWSPAGGSVTNTASVKFRVSGSGTWKDGYPLWYDVNTNEYRGSIVNLTPNTSYEIQTILASGATASATLSTWSETFPVARTITVPQTTSTLNITEGGSASGYVVYTPSAGSTGANIAVGSSAENAVSVSANYVIIKGFKITGGSSNSILINGSNHVVIEGNDISDWGWQGSDHNSAVYSRDVGTSYIIVQRNRIYNPHVGSNDWNSGHPSGPNTFGIWNSNGHNVVRYNDLFSNNGNYYNDVLGAGTNKDVGYPGQDSDIYGNIVQNAWDDCIETDGFGSNVRVWNNYISNCLAGISVAPVIKGPVYIWRNVTGVLQRSPGTYSDAKGFIKTAGASAPTKGRVFVFNNTTLQPNGATSGLYNGPTENIYTRNNIFYTQSASDDVYSDANFSSNNFDYDLYNGTLSEAYSGANPNGIRGVPLFLSNAGLTSGYFLTSSSPGYGRGQILNNFADSYSGTGPDMGAYQTGKAPIQFGKDATFLP